MFARSLFANMLWFGAEETLAAFKEVVHLLPARLVVTLGMYAESYFEPGRKRMVKPLGECSFDRTTLFGGSVYGGSAKSDGEGCTGFV